MKKIISVLLTITMLLGVTATVPLSVSAATTGELTYTDEYGEWTYKLNDNGDGCIITGYDKSMTTVEIPSMIDNLPVVEIGYYAFEECNKKENPNITEEEMQQIFNKNLRDFCDNLEQKGVQILEKNVKIVWKSEQAILDGKLYLLKRVDCFRSIQLSTDTLENKDEKPFRSEISE